MLARRRFPVVSCAVLVTVALTLMLAVGGPTAAIAFAGVGLYTAASRGGLRAALITFAVTAVGYLAVEAVLDGGFDDRAFAPLSLLGAATALGVAAGTQRAAVRAAEQRAREAELTRDREAARRVTEERLRIARELHDVVAHHVSVVNVQAGVVGHLMESNPAQARAALQLVRSASGTAISELGAAVGLLRTAEDEAGHHPAVGLDQVDALVQSVQRAGLTVSVQITGQERPLEELADLSAYRIIQESLTNALRHGAGSAQLRIDHRREDVVIEVRNPLPLRGTQPPFTRRKGEGYGLVGMRERAAVIGADLSAGPDPANAETFLVRARITRRHP